MLKMKLIHSILLAKTKYKEEGKVFLFESATIPMYLQSNLAVKLESDAHTE